MLCTFRKFLSVQISGILNEIDQFTYNYVENRCKREGLLQPNPL